ncbi:MAG TPA: DUF58 domain-containing protein [Armatimonadota bacterium]|jgi:uncharacterized protein (DUF58 family)
MIPTLPAFLLLLLSTAVALSGVNRPGALRVGAWAFAGVVVLIVLDNLLSRRLVRLEGSRSVADRLSLAEANPVRLELVNRSRWTLRLTVQDDAPWEFEASLREHNLRLAPFERGELTYTVTPRRRGDYDFGNLHVRCLSLLGLSQWQRRLPLAEWVRVYPDLLEINHYAALARSRQLQQAGFRPLPYLGEGATFESLREYSPDDDFRRIDWKATARRGYPVTRQYDLERSQNLILMIDAGRMMTAEIGGMSKLDYAVNAALMLAYVAVERDDAVGLIVFDDEVRTWVPPAKGRRQVGLIADQLYAVEPVLREPDYGQAFALLRRRTQRRALVVAFTDLIDRDSSAQLLSNVLGLAPRHLPLVVTLRDQRLDALAAARPAEAAEAYERAVATSLLAQRRLALATLRRGGAQLVDTAAGQLTVDTVNKYLEIKRRTVL